MVVFRRAVFPAAAAIIAVTGCREATDPESGIPASAVAIAGDAQIVAAGSAVSTAPSVKVTDSRGNPVRGITITFSVASGGGSVTGATATTDASGIATVGGWTLGTTAGSNTLTASVGSLNVTFTATAVAGAATSLAPVVAATQSATVNTGVGVAPSVVLKDAHGNPVPNIAVTFAVGTSGGTLTGASQTTNAQGIATVGGWMVGQTAGSYSLTATSGPLTTMFTATALAGPAATIAPLAGNDQVAPTNSIVPVRPAVIVRDAFGNAVANAMVTFSVGSGGGAVTGDVQTTNSEGVATVGSWILGPQSGNNSLNVSSGSAMAPFSATAIAASTDGSLRFTMLTSGAVGQAGGGGHTCSLDINGRAYCWGLNGHGQLGDGTTMSRTTPVAVSGSLNFVLVTGGWKHSCGLRSTGAAYCWGDNGSGQLGTGGPFPPVATPASVAGGLTFTTLVAGSNFTCGLTSDGKAYCWGSNFLGGLGIGDSTQTDRRTPVAVAGGLTFASLSAGHAFACGLTTVGKAYCWGGGSPYHGVLGDGTAPVSNPPPPGDPLYVRFRPSPTAVLGGIAFTRISLGSFGACGLDLAGKAYCWGLNSFGQIGDGTGTSRGAPVLVSGGLTFANISVGAYHACGRLASGALRCWGGNFDGQYGNGQTLSGNTPSNSANGLALASVGAGDRHTCGLDSSGKIYCWGNNQFGQVGDGTTTGRTTPVAVVFP